jgi:cyclophilin family peptidyl-prolyl cis-trans isomerase
MAREEYVADSASSQVFWLLFESDLTPAGKNLLDGRYACFGYTVEVGRGSVFCFLVGWFVCLWVLVLMVVCLFVWVNGELFCWLVCVLVCVGRCGWWWWADVCRMGRWWLGTDRRTHTHTLSLSHTHTHSLSHTQSQTLLRSQNPNPHPPQQNAELLAGVKEGDVISSAKVLSGLENLKK